MHIHGLSHTLHTEWLRIQTFQQKPWSQKAVRRHFTMRKGGEKVKPSPEMYDFIYIYNLNEETTFSDKKHICGHQT